MCDSQAIKDKWVGVHNRLNGRSGTGVDCIGLIYTIYADRGINLPGRSIQKSDMSALLSLLHQCFSVAKDKIKAFDVILFRLPGERYTVHCGVSLGGDEFIHVLGSSGVKVDSMAGWQSRLIKTYRLR